MLYALHEIRLDPLVFGFDSMEAAEASDASHLTPYTSSVRPGLEPNMMRHCPCRFSSLTCVGGGRLFSLLLWGLPALSP